MDALAGRRTGSDEGIEVHGRAEGVHHSQGEEVRRWRRSAARPGISQANYFNGKRNCASPRGDGLRARSGGDGREVRILTVIDTYFRYARVVETRQLRLDRFRAKRFAPLGEPVLEEAPRDEIGDAWHTLSRKASSVRKRGISGSVAFGMCRRACPAESNPFSA